MRRSLYTLALLIALFACSGSADAALTATARGTGGNNTGATSVTVTPQSNLAAGSMGVIMIALDNAGTAGSATVCAASMTDSVNNAWTRQQNGLFDNGAASAGVEIAFYTAKLTTAFTTADNVVVSFGSTSVTAKAWALWEIAPAAGKTVSYITGAIGTGSTTGTPTITTGTITNGDAVIGGGGAESADTWAGDADTSNGSWSIHQHNGFGTGTSGMSVTSQVKVVSADATQIYNPTLTSVDTILGWIQVRETSLSSGFFHFFN